MVKNNHKALQALAGDLEKSYGKQAVGLGRLQRSLNVVPSGSLALDYAMGTGGWPLGHVVGVFGHRDIGKSSVVGFGAIRNAQAMGMNCAYIALEPHYDEKWAEKHGVDVENLLLTWPTSGEEAFAQLHRIVRSGVVDVVIFDSIGAVISEVEMVDDGKPRVGGQAQLITWGMKSIAPLVYRNNMLVMMLNQVRHDMRPGVKGMVYKQPGGEALEHFETIIVQLRRGKNRYTIKQHGEDVQVGQEIVAQITRNKVSEGGGRKAVFDFFSMETDDYPFGIDMVTDVINTAKRVGVLGTPGTSWIDLPDGQRVNGVGQAAAYLRENPLVLDLVREAVLRKMTEGVAMKFEEGELDADLDTELDEAIHE